MNGGTAGADALRRVSTPARVLAISERGSR
jgi:hypothetical protein